MLSIEPGSVCDVCAEEYGTRKFPACIPCGHVLCNSCANTICAKTSIRLNPACPFCREQFTHETIRIIRIDVNTPIASGSTTPLNPHSPARSPLNNPKDLPFPVVDDTRPTEIDCLRARQEAKRLEDRVAMVAAKKCSVEEVSSLHRELQTWLSTDVDCKSDGDTASLSLSAALLRAILMNHVSHTESSKHYRANEVSLKEKLDQAESVRLNLEAELRKQQAQYAMKAQECQSLRAELSKVKISAPGAASLGFSTARPSAPPPTSPTGHIRAHSVSLPSHISPPATPAPSSSSSVGIGRATTPGPLYASPSRTASIHSSSGVSRSSTPAAQPQRSSTPGGRAFAPSNSSFSGAPPVPSPLKPRRNSNPVPPAAAPKILRSTSDDRPTAAATASISAQSLMHARWIPSEPPVPQSRPQTARPQSPPHTRPYTPFQRGSLAQRALSPGR